jgi:hypothetical protein
MLLWGNILKYPLAAKKGEEEYPSMAGRSLEAFLARFGHFTYTPILGMAIHFPFILRRHTW